MNSPGGIIASNLQELREARGWERRDLAKKTGISRRSIEGHEHGRTMKLFTFRIYERFLPGLRKEHVTNG